MKKSRVNMIRLKVGRGFEIAAYFGMEIEGTAGRAVTVK